MAARILAEDDDSMRELIRIHLSSAGYEVTTAARNWVWWATSPSRCVRRSCCSWSRSMSPEAPSPSAEIRRLKSGTDHVLKSGLSLMIPLVIPRDKMM